eukprot:TRINITY_DN23883_c0_g1_i1.p1 TRINITY_DN23883_c0_g1~~TRINITY_DN23883_c0_g1_i1.p1  ORF type:complete len:175 (-),score=39.32 TRINITY_DN23883_c0_g1_i1:15-539(-)
MGNSSERMKQADVDTMLQTTAFSEQELRRLFVRFTLQGKSMPVALPPAATPQQKLFKRFYDMLVRVPEERRFPEFVGTIVTLSDGSQATSEAKLKFAFDVFDANGDGALSNGELFQVLRLLIADVTEEELQQICDRTILEFNKTGEGTISFDDFKQYLEKNSEDIIEKLTITWQ